MLKNVAKPKPIKLIRIILLRKTSSLHIKANKTKRISLMTIILLRESLGKAKGSLFMDLMTTTLMEI